jgi:hypothetical protein
MTARNRQPATAGDGFEPFRHRRGRLDFPSNAPALFAGEQSPALTCALISKNDRTRPIDAEGCRMFCDFTDDDRYDAWKALVVSAIGGVLVAGLFSGILWLW